MVLALCLVGGPSFAPVAADTDEHHESAAHHDGAESHGDAHHHAPAVSDLLFPAINFAIYSVIVVVYVIPAMREFLRRRSADVAQAQSEAGAALARAEDELASKKARLAGLTAEADGLRQDLIAIATRQGERLKAQAEESGARRVADASLLAEQERRRAWAEIRADVARDATELAEQRIRAVLTPDDQRTFVEQFLKDAATR
jgi:F0F1-type ATP synthase membrane subunit b/b'